MNRKKYRMSRTSVQKFQTDRASVKHGSISRNERVTAGLVNYDRTRRANRSLIARPGDKRKYREIAGTFRFHFSRWTYVPLGTPGRIMDEDGTIARGCQLIRVVRLRRVISQPRSIPPNRFASITSVGVQPSTGSERFLSVIVAGRRGWCLPRTRLLFFLEFLTSKWEPSFLQND